MMGNKISALCEYLDIVVIIDLLRVKSFFSTHSFQLCHILASVKHQYLIQLLSNDGDYIESDDGDNVVDVHEDVSDAVDRMMNTGDDNIADNECCDENGSRALYALR